MNNTIEKVKDISKIKFQDRYDRHYHPKNDHHKKHLIIDAVLSVVVVTLVIFSIYLLGFYRATNLRDQIRIQITPISQHISSGQDLTLGVVIENTTKDDLQDAVLKFSPTSHFVLPAGYKIGEIPANSLQEFTLTGEVIADINQPVHINAILDYRTSALSAFASKYTTEFVDVNDSRLVLDTNFPENLISNREFTFELLYENSSKDFSFSNISIVPNFPPSFELIDGGRGYNSELGIWQLDKVSQLDKGSIEVTGIAAAQIDQLDFSFQIFTSPNREPLLQSETEIIVPVYDLELEVTLSTDNQIASLGDELTYNLQLLNTGDVDLRDVYIRLKAHKGLFEEDTKEFLVISQLQRNQLVQRPFKLKLKESINPNTVFEFKNPAVYMQADLVVVRDGLQIVYPLNSITTDLQSDLGVDAFARYHSSDGEQIGVGPIPPRVGESTTYWVFMELSNKLHSIRNAQLVFTLPENVEWLGRISVTQGDQPEFNTITRQVLWNAGNLSDYTTQFSDEAVGIAFQVKITPKESDLNQVITLVQDIEVRGIDNVTNSALFDRVNPVTTYLENDKFVEDEGKVRL